MPERISNGLRLNCPGYLSGNPNISRPVNVKAIKRRLVMGQDLSAGKCIRIKRNLIISGIVWSKLIVVNKEGANAGVRGKVGGNRCGCSQCSVHIKRQSVSQPHYLKEIRDSNFQCGQGVSCIPTSPGTVIAISSGINEGLSQDAYSSRPKVRLDNVSASHNRSRC